jgi:hypothetical protein
MKPISFPGCSANPRTNSAALTAFLLLCIWPTWTVPARGAEDVRQVTAQVLEAAGAEHWNGVTKIYVAYDRAAAGTGPINSVGTYWLPASNQIEPMPDRQRLTKSEEALWRQLSAAIWGHLWLGHAEAKVRLVDAPKEEGREQTGVDAQLFGLEATFGALAPGVTIRYLFRPPARLPESMVVTVDGGQPVLYQWEMVERTGPGFIIPHRLRGQDKSFVVVADCWIE